MTYHYRHQCNKIRKIIFPHFCQQVRLGNLKIEEKLLIKLYLQVIQITRATTIETIFHFSNELN